MLIAALMWAGYQSMGGEKLYCGLLVSFGFLSLPLIKIISIVIIINIIT